MPGLARWAGALLISAEEIDVMGLTGRWRIIATELWDTDAIDLVGPGFIELDRRRSGWRQSPGSV